MSGTGSPDGGDGLTVIVPTLDRPELLIDLLHSIAAGDDQPDEVLVIDQSARCSGAVEALAVATGLAIEHVHVPFHGVSRARNEGARRARCARLAFVDDDVLVDPGWCRAMRSALDREATAVVTGRVDAGEPERSGAFTTSTIEDDEPRRHTTPGHVDVLYTGNCGLRRATLERVGGFDERLGPGTPFPSAEDNDLAHRLLAAGIEIVYEPAAIVRHRAWRPRSDAIAVRWRYGLGQGAFLAKHARDRRHGTLPRLRRQLARSARRAVANVRRDRRATAEHVAMALGVIVGVARWTLIAGRHRGRTPALRHSEPSDD
jgi:GT2 family glycosyltransferase